MSELPTSVVPTASQAGRSISRSSTMCDLQSPSATAGKLATAMFEVEPLFPDRLCLSMPVKPTISALLPLSSDPSSYLNSEPDCSYGWTRYVHPSGRVYRYNHRTRTLVHGEGPLLAGEWRDFVQVGEEFQLQRNDLGRMATHTIESLWRRLPKTVAASQCELFFQTPRNPSRDKAEYYFVHWEKRAVFWVEDNFGFLPHTSQAHRRDLLESNFWAHVDHFPMHHALPSRSRGELEKILSYQIVDQTTYNDSTAPWSAVDTQMLCKSIRIDDDDIHRPLLRSQTSRSSTLASMGDAPSKPGASGERRPSLDSQSSGLHESDIVTAYEPEPIALYLSKEEGIVNATVARIWRQVCLTRAINLYGDLHARLGRTERRPSIYHDGKDEDRSPPAWVRRVMSALLFTRPAYFFGALEDVFVDQILYQRAWQDFVDKEVLPEWRDNGVVAAVVLATNMGFLALNGIEGADSPVAVGWKILSLSSTLSSMGTILASMMLIQSYQSLKSATAEEANRYMVRCSRWPLGIFGMAVLFSMPFVMLMASLITFIVAVLGYSLQHWALTTALPLLLTTVVPIVFVLVLQTVFLGTGSCQRRRDRRAKMRNPDADIEQQPLNTGAARSMESLTSPSFVSEKVR